MAWETRTCFEVVLTTRRERGTCDKVEILDGGVLRIEKDQNGVITHFYNPRDWVSCDVWEESVS